MCREDRSAFARRSPSIQPPPPPPLTRARRASWRGQAPEGTLLTIELLLERDSWIADLGNPIAYERTRKLLGGLRRGADDAGRPAEDSGWDQVVGPALVSACTSLDCSVVQRVNSESVIITLPSFPLYDITYPETIELTAPRETVLSDQAIIAVNVLVLRPTPGTVHLTGSLIDAFRMGLPTPLPLREAEIAAGGALTERTLRIVPRVNDTDLVVKVNVGDRPALTIEIRNDTFRLYSFGSVVDMQTSTKRALLDGLRADKDECTGWNGARARRRRDRALSPLRPPSAHRHQKPPPRHSAAAAIDVDAPPIPLVAPPRAQR